MDVPEPEELAQSPDDDKKFSGDSYLSPTFFRHAHNCSVGPIGEKSPFRSLTIGRSISNP